MITANCFIKADWPAAANIRAYCTTRQQGYSQAPYDSFNLAHHVGDDPNAVANNRRLLREKLQLPNEPLWLDQVHGTRVINSNNSLDRVADACYTTEPNQVCVILSADCLPLLLCDQQATCIAAIHVGWRGLVNGIIDKTIQTLGKPAENLLAWLGPCIGPNAFEVGDDVRDACILQNQNAAQAFTTYKKDKWLANLYQLAKLELKKINVHHIYGGNYCTYRETERFYSYRRDKITGRIASLIWLSSHPT